MLSLNRLFSRIPAFGATSRQKLVHQMECRLFSTATMQAYSAESQEILVDVSSEAPHVYHMRLNRPSRRNAITFELWGEMKTVVERLEHEPNCRVIVVSGNGDSFCSGIDLQDGLSVSGNSCLYVGNIRKHRRMSCFMKQIFQNTTAIFQNVITTMSNEELDVGRRGIALGRFLQVAQDGFNAIAKCRKPVIAAVHNHCIGVGAELIMACDIRIASQDANFSIKEVDVGLAPDVGALSRMQKIVGNDSWVREMCFTCRNFNAEEALRHGFISRIYPTAKETLDAATQLAKTISEKSPIAIQGTKVNLNYSRDHSDADGQLFVKAWNMGMLQSEDLVESAKAYMAKRKPLFKNV
ncbi:hypothetical protein WR25_07798 [Diploscapter pachys]|uniref:3-hydroxyisobutyryl-coenzyme A hydrolase n=1 Tax=Diploscapter pachys TaxID=2018661 RepID=A0A2A2JPN5_9BILA|nr:hypothetical protein WR25_07798 [Diploscapter pachys]